MLEDLIFSINIVLPVFGIIILGFILKRKKIVTEAFIKSGDKLVFNILLPANLFLSVYNADLNGLFDVKFILFAVIATCLSFSVIWVLSELFIKDKSVIGTFVQGSFRGNFALLGLPLFINIVGKENAIKSVMIIIFVVPMYSILSIIVLSSRSKLQKPINIKNMLLSVVRNPLIIATLSGIIISALKIKFPFLITKWLEYLSVTAAPLALICLGGNIAFNEREAKFKYSIWSSVIKVIIQPIVLAVAAYILGFRSYDFVLLLLLFGVPSAVSSYSMAVIMDGDAYVASTTVVLTTLLSIFTIPIFVYIVKSLGILT